jgi:hypothetical protein
MNQIKAILIDSNKKSIREVYITNPAYDLEKFFIERKELIEAKFDGCKIGNLYDDKGEILARGHENSFFNNNYYFGNGFKIINSELFNDRLIWKNTTCFYGNMLIVGELIFNITWEKRESSFVSKMVLNVKYSKEIKYITIDLLSKSLEWIYTEYHDRTKYKMSRSEKLAEAEEILKNRII